MGNIDDARPTIGTEHVVSVMRSILIRLPPSQTTAITSHKIDTRGHLQVILASNEFESRSRSVDVQITILSANGA